MSIYGTAQFEGAADIGALIFENAIEDAAHILQHHGARADLIDDIDSGGKQVAFVLGVELLAGAGD